MSFNLPPGCNASDLPGNRPEDAAYESWMDRALSELDKLGVDEDMEHEDWITGRLTVQYDREMSPEGAARAVADEYAAHDWAQEDDK